MRPDSARGVLRRLAKITARNTKVGTPLQIGVGKENVRPLADDGEDDMVEWTKPRLTLDVEGDDSLDLDGSALPEGYEEDDDSEVLAAPTPSVLPDDDKVDGGVAIGENKNVTFKSIEFARQAQNQLGGSEKIDRRKSRLSYAPVGGDLEGQGDEEDDDPTMLTERGRRAISEEMTGRFSRYSFGSIRMSDFGEELEFRRESDPKAQRTLNETRQSIGVMGGQDLLLEGETEDLSRLRRFMEAEDELEDEDGPLLGGDDEEFQLFVPEEELSEAAALHQDRRDLQPQTLRKSPEVEAGEGTRPSPNEDHPTPASPGTTRRLTDLEIAALATTKTRRRKRMKVTKHGTTVPSLPSSLIKRIATETQVRNGRRRPMLGRDHMKALEQATEWFFEQAGEDLSAYAEHARRKKRVDASDALMLMRRQRVLRGDGQVRELAEEFLPKEILDELDLPNDA